MANNKEFFTRIQLKYDTWNNWDSVKSTFKPLAGEVCLVQIPSKVDGKSPSGFQDVPPSVLLKVGDGTNYFQDLPWLSGLAADVHAWAKKSDTDFITWVKTQLSYVTPEDLADIEARIKALEDWRATLKVTANTGLVKGLAQTDGKISYATATGDDIPDHGYDEAYSGEELFSHVKVVDTLEGSEAATARVVPSVKAVKEIAADLESLETDFGKLNVKVSGEGNAVTTGSYDSTTQTITLTKGATYNNYSLPTATNQTLGGVKLSDATDSESSINGGIAATPAAVKAAKDAADSAQSDADAALDYIKKLYGGAYPGATDPESILAIVNKEIAAAVSNNASFDTLEEIAAWIAAHPESVAAINADLLDVRKEVYGTENGKVAASGKSRIDINEDDIDNIEAAIAAMDEDYTRAAGKVIKTLKQTDGVVVVTDESITYADIPQHRFNNGTVSNGYIGDGTYHGHVKLSDATNSSSNASAGIAATPAAVKAAYDLAAEAQSDAAAAAVFKFTNGTGDIVTDISWDASTRTLTETKGKVPAHASASTEYGAGDGTNLGHVKLSDSTEDSTSDVSKYTAATPKAVNAVKTMVDNLSGDIAALALDDLVPNGTLDVNDRYVIFNCGSATKLI